MNIIIENAVCLNTGDAAIMLAIRKVLRETFGENITLTVFDSDAETCAALYPASLYPDITFRPLLAPRLFRWNPHAGRRRRLADGLRNLKTKTALRLWAKGVSAAKCLLSAADRGDLSVYKDSALVITTGGTYLVEHYDMELRFLQFDIDRTLGKPPVFFTQSLGPFRKERNREKLRPVLASSHLILLRDQASRDNLSGMVADGEKCHVVADSVFAFADRAKLEELVGEKTDAPRKGRVAVSVRQWNVFPEGSAGMDGYRQAVSDLVCWLVEKAGMEVVFLSTCQGVPAYRYDDSALAQEMADALPDGIRSRVTVNRDFHRPEELLDMLAGFDFVVATRMHMMILSLCAGTPVLPVAYEFKTAELAKRLGLESVLCAIDTVQPAELIGKASAFLEDLPAMRRATMRGVLEEYRSAMGVTALLKDVPLPC